MTAGRGRPRSAEATASLVEARQLGAARMAFNLTPAELAEFLGTHLRTVQRWEAGDREIPPHLWVTLALMYRLDGRPAPRGKQRLPISAAATDWIRARSPGPKTTP